MENKEKEVQTTETVEKVDVKVEKMPEGYVKFSKTFQFEGVEYKGVQLELGKIRGRDLEVAEARFVSENPEAAAVTPMKDLSKGYQAIIASMASNLPVELFRALPANDYNKVCQKVQVFLLK